MGPAKKVILLVMYMGLLFMAKTPCFALEEENEVQSKQDITDEYYSNFLGQEEIVDIDEDLQEIRRKYNLSGSISFKDIMDNLLCGQIDQAIHLAFTDFYNELMEEVLLNRELLVRIILLVIIAAVFNNYSSILKMSYVGEQGFYITYLMIAVLLIQSFTLVYEIAEETIYYIRDLMQCMLPAFYLSIVLCSGLTTSQMVNSMFVGMLSFVENILLVVFLPAIRIYFLIVLLNQLNKKDRFSKLSGLIKQGIQFGLKAITTGIIGLNVVKSMLVPVYENARYNALQKGLSMIPGGTALSGLTSIMVGAGILIKNSVGVTVVIIMLVLAGIPIVKMFAFYVIYKILVAFIQPISDNRILAGIQGICDSTGILLRATATSVVLSVLSVAIVILTTNVRM
ncbi:MAG: stage III sporulation protein AE [Lachnospiraceae bacterium]